MEKVSAGDRFVAAQDIPTSALTHWRAPGTFGFDTIIPKGTVLVAPDDAVEGAEGFYCVPERYDEMELALVPEKDRLADKYNGYSFVLPHSALGTKLSRL